MERDVDIDQSDQKALQSCGLLTVDELEILHTASKHAEPSVGGVRSACVILWLRPPVPS